MTTNTKPKPACPSCGSTDLRHRVDGTAFCRNCAYDGPVKKE